MLRNVTIIVFCFIVTTAYSQKSFDYNFYFNGTLGFGLPISNTESKLNNSNNNGAFFDNGSAYINIKNKFGLHLKIIGIGYGYDIPVEEIQADNPGYFLWSTNHSYSHVKLGIYSGVGYKFNYKRFVIIPYVDLGFIPHATSSVDSYKLKEEASNNIKQINNNVRIDYSKFDYSFGADFFFHFGKHWGFATTVQYDRFSGSSYFETTITDSYSYELRQASSSKFDHKNVLISFGLFVSFFKNDAIDKSLKGEQDGR